MTRDVATRGAIALLALGGAMPTAALAANLQTGFYALHSHPDGNQSPPPYGLRLDGLNGDTSQEFTFDFDGQGAAMWLVLSGSGPSSWKMEITGQAYGGRDVGSAYANDQWLGLYDIDFTYDVSVESVPGDDDIWVVASSGENAGIITAPNGNQYLLEDKSNGSFTFRFGDEDNDAGHRGFDGISGWGWLMHGLIVPGAPTQTQHVVASDWLFTAEKSDVPTPGAVSLLAGALGLAGTRRRRRNAR